jgi:hypothetical protein
MKGFQQLLTVNSFQYPDRILRDYLIYYARIIQFSSTLYFYRLIADLA